MKVVLVLSLLAWPGVLRLMRGSVLQVKHNEYVLAARALGAGNSRIIWRHILPNAVTPVLTLTTITVGAFIVAEATLSFLGIGLVPPAVSWGVAIDEALPFVYSYPHMLLFPSLFLSLCVLSVHHARRRRPGRVRPQVPMTRPDSCTERESGR